MAVELRISPASMAPTPSTVPPSFAPGTQQVKPRAYTYILRHKQRKNRRKSDKVRDGLVEVTKLELAASCSQTYLQYFSARL